MWHTSFRLIPRWLVFLHSNFLFNLGFFIKLVKVIDNDGDGKSNAEHSTQSTAWQLTWFSTKCNFIFSLPSSTLTPWTGQKIILIVIVMEGFEKCQMCLWRRDENIKGDTDTDNGSCDSDVTITVYSKIKYIWLPFCYFASVRKHSLS